MLNLHNLKPKKGYKKKKKRVGRGNASKGNYSGRGIKGQKARAGSGGMKRLSLKQQLLKKIPKLRGFKSLKQKPQIVNLYQIEEKFKEKDEIKKQDLKNANLIKSKDEKVKLLAKGKLTKKIIIYVDDASKKAILEVEKLGGKVIIK